MVLCIVKRQRTLDMMQCDECDVEKNGKNDEIG